MNMKKNAGRRLACVTLVLAWALAGAARAGSLPDLLRADAGVAEAWNAGRRDEALAHLREVVTAKGELGVVYGRVVNPDGTPPTDQQKSLIAVGLPEGRMIVYNDYWSDDGWFAFAVPAGEVRVFALGTQYAADTGRERVRAGETVDLGTLKLKPAPRPKDRSRITLRVRLADREERAGITVRADALDKNYFSAVTDATGYAEIAIPARAGRFRITSDVPGYASIWSFLNMPAQPVSVDLGSFVLTRRKQVTLRWRTPKESRSRSLADSDTGRITMRSYDEVMAPEGKLGRELSFARKEMIAVNWDVRGDLRLAQSGDAIPLVEEQPKFYRTSTLDFFPGTLAHADPGRAAMADLGAQDLDAMTEVPEDGLRPYHDRKGVPVIVGHVYAWRSFDGTRYAAFVVESVEDAPLDPS